MLRPVDDTHISCNIETYGKLGKHVTFIPMRRVYEIYQYISYDNYPRGFMDSVKQCGE